MEIDTMCRKKTRVQERREEEEEEEEDDARW